MTVRVPREQLTPEQQRQRNVADYIGLRWPPSQNDLPPMLMPIQKPQQQE